MSTQKAIVIPPLFGAQSSLEVGPLNELLGAGWKVVATEASTNCALLVILESPDRGENP